MYTLYKLNADELDSRFLESLKAQFPHKVIEISEAGLIDLLIVGAGHARDETPQAHGLVCFAAMGRSYGDCDKPIKPTSEISVCEAGQSAEDETAYLLKSPANRERLLASIAHLGAGNTLVNVDLS